MRLDALIVRAAIARTGAGSPDDRAPSILVDGQRVRSPVFPREAGTAHPITPRAEGMEPFQVAPWPAVTWTCSQDSATLPRGRIDKLQARLVRRPKRAEVPVTCEVQLVVEYYAAR
jgi:small subunit ribosomal protein S4